MTKNELVIIKSYEWNHLQNLLDEIKDIVDKIKQDDFHKPCLKSLSNAIVRLEDFKDKLTSEIAIQEALVNGSIQKTK